MKKILPIAVLSALAGVNGAQAVHVNPDGLGQVLLYPYYTTEGGQDTYINLVNTTNQVKAVKIRFRESLNSAEVLDFNLYLSPQDHWSAVITAGTTTDAATITSGDSSCTVPAAIADGTTISFRGSEYAADSENGLDRTGEGYVEVIEMGVVTDAVLAAAATHVAGTPANCAAMTSAWSTGGQWDLDRHDGLDVATGGLYGYGVIINVPDGAAAMYDAVALDDFVFTTGNSIHFAPGDSSPSLSDGRPEVNVFDGANGVINAVTFDSIDAVSAALMHNTISNDYVLEPTINAGTDWVITFPTKRDYVNAGLRQPFTDSWSSLTSEACEEIDITYYDREEADESPDPLDFSPAPVQGTETLCAEANVLTFNNSNVLQGSDRGTARNLNLDGGFINGWMRMNFEADPFHTLITAVPVVTFVGLPTIGFAVQKYVNGDAGGSGVLANYAGAVSHKSTRNVITSVGP